VNALSTVLAGLVPAIHVLFSRCKGVDARHKAGHDAECLAREVVQPAAFSFATSLAKVSRRPMVRLNTGLPGAESGSRQK
jgi:hypothetical protein